MGGEALERTCYDIVLSDTTIGTTLRRINGFTQEGIGGENSEPLGGMTFGEPPLPPPIDTPLACIYLIDHCVLNGIFLGFKSHMCVDNAEI